MLFRSVDDHSPGAFGLARLQRAIAAEAAPARRYWRPAAAAALAATVATLGLFVLKSGPDAGQDRYTQASGEVSKRLLTVTFRPDATESAISDLLLTNNLVIVDGPSALGLYRVQFDEGSDARAIMAVLKRDRKSTRLNSSHIQKSRMPSSA